MDLLQSHPLFGYSNFPSPDPALTSSAPPLQDFYPSEPTGGKQDLSTGIVPGGPSIRNKNPRPFWEENTPASIPIPFGQGGHRR